MNKKRIVPGIIYLILAILTIVFYSVSIFEINGEKISIYLYMKNIGWGFFIIIGYFLSALFIQTDLFVFFVDKPKFQKRVDIQSLIFCVLSVGFFITSLIMTMIAI